MAHLVVLIQNQFDIVGECCQPGQDFAPNIEEENQTRVLPDRPGSPTKIRKKSDEKKLLVLQRC